MCVCERAVFISERCTFFPHTSLHRGPQASVYHCDKVQPLGGVEEGWGGGKHMRGFACGCCQLSIHHRVTANCAPVVHSVFRLQAVKQRECQENENVLQPCAPAGWLHAFPSWKAPI